VRGEGDEGLHVGEADSDRTRCTSVAEKRFPEKTSRLHYPSSLFATPLRQVVGKKGRNETKTKHQHCSCTAEKGGGK
jgi:hypothetical protein